jgi:hypothetical protein
VSDQTKRLYRMENTFMRAGMYGYVPRAELQELADKACRRWNVPPVKVVFSRNTYWYGEYSPDEKKIRLFDAKKRKRPGSGRNRLVLLHEVAHHIDNELFPDSETGDHGPTFAKVAMDLYDHYKVLPRSAFRMLAKKHGVKVSASRRKR